MIVNFLREDRARSVSIFKFKINTRSGRPWHQKHAKHAAIVPSWFVKMEDFYRLLSVGVVDLFARLDRRKMDGAPDTVSQF